MPDHVDPYLIRNSEKLANDNGVAKSMLRMLLFAPNPKHTQQVALFITIWKARGTQARSLAAPYLLAIVSAAAVPRNTLPVWLEESHGVRELDAAPNLRRKLFNK